MTLRRAVLFGGSGRLGRALVEALRARGAEVLLPARQEADVSDAAAVEAAVESARAEVVWNAAAYSDVDGAERDPSAAGRVNVEGPGNLASAASRAGALLVHFGTNYVFDGRSRDPYAEDSGVNPLSVYGWTKLEGERAVVESGATHLIVRTSWLFAPWGTHAVSRFIAAARRGEEVRAISDETGSPTSVIDLAEACADLVEAGARGLVNVVNAGEATWFDVAIEALRLAGLDARVSAVRGESLGRPAERPAYSVLSTGRAEAILGRPMRHWREALADCVARMGR